MKYLKALLLTLAATFLLPVYGDEADQDVAQYNKQYYYKRDTSPPSACSMVEEKMDGQYGIYMPAHFGCPCNDGFLIALDFLCMRAKNESLVYAHQNTEDIAFGGPATLLNQINQGQMIRPERHWDPGFRLALGWDTFFDHWDVYSSWTYYHNKSITEHSVPNTLLASTLVNTNEGLFPYWFPADDTVEGVTVNQTVKFQNLYGVWQLNYNTLKLELGRSLYLTKAFSLRPHFGLQNSWIHQKMRARYSRSFIAPNSGIGSIRQSVDANNKADFWGIGMCAGLDSSWDVGSGISFLAKVSGALLSARTNVRRVDSAASIGEEFFRVGNYRDRVEQITPELETGLGLSWGTCLSKGTMFLSFSATWETLFWWQQFQFLRPQFGNSTSYQNAWNEYPFTNNTLIIEGVSISGRFDF